MYVENKRGGLTGQGRIGWVVLSKSKRSYFYDGRELLKVGNGYKYNCIDVGNGDTYWVSGPRKDGADHLYGGIVAIDEMRVPSIGRRFASPSRAAETEYRAGASTRTAGSTRRNERQRMRGSQKSKGRR